MKSVVVASSSNSSSVTELFSSSATSTTLNGHPMPLPTVAINSTRRAFIYGQNDSAATTKTFTFDNAAPSPSPPHTSAAASSIVNGSDTNLQVPSAFAQALASTRNVVQTQQQEIQHHANQTSNGNGSHLTDLQSRHRSPNLHIQSRSVDSTPLPSPAHYQRNGHASQQTTHTSRLPPRVPTLPNLSRTLTASSTTSTDSMFFNHPLPHSTPHFTSPIDYATTVPSLSDLVSPSEPVPIQYDTWKNGAAKVIDANSQAQQQQQRMHQKAIAANHGAATAPTTPHSSNSTLMHHLPPPSYMSTFATSPPSQFAASPNTLTSTPMDDIPIAWRELLARQESVDYIRADPAVHALIATGVPHSIRGELWKLLSGSLEERRRYPRSYYSKLLALHKIKGSIYDDEIRRDLARTLPAVDMFNPRKQPEGDTGPSIPLPTANPMAPPPQTQFAWNGTGGLARLNRVLCAYATRNKTLGYCQGMNMLAGTLLTLLNEEDAFWILVTIIENRIGYYAKSMCGLEVDQCVFGSLVNYFLPHLGDHLRQFDVTIPSFTVSWFVCLFVEAPLNQLHQIYPTWDHLFCKGDEFLFSMSLALLQYKEREILKKKETGELLEFLLHSGFRRHVPDSPVQSLPDPSGTTPAAASPVAPHPLDIYFLLQTAIPRLGSLSREISSLREYHRNVILTKSKTLHIHTAQRLASLYKYPNSDEIQKLWNVFLSPAPWSILLHGSLTSLVKFYEAFCVHIFPDAIRRKWRDQGLFSGVVERLFQTIDSEHSGEISFEQFLAAVYLFTKGEQEEKYRFVFRFFDTDFDGMISAAEMKKVFILFHRMYNGATIGTSNSLTADETKAALAQQQKRKNSMDGEFVSEQPPSATPVATVDEVMNGDDSETISSMFVSMIFQKAAELIVAQASKAAAATVASTAATTTITPVPTVTSVLTSLYSTGMGYSHFRRVISLHPFTQLTFGLTIHESQSARQQLARTNAVEAANAQASGPSPAPPSIPPQPPASSSAGISSSGPLASSAITATPRSRRGSITGLPLANGNPNTVTLPSASSTPLIVARKVSMTTTSAPPALTSVPSAIPPAQ